MNCHKIREVVFLYTDNELERSLRIEVREHLVICPQCARQIEYTRRILDLLRRSCLRAEAPLRLREKILASMPHRRTRAEKGWE